MSEALKKADKQFLINVNLSNRQFLTTINTLLLALAVAFTSLFMAIYTVLISIGLNKLYLGGILIILIILIRTIWFILNKRTNNALKKINEQYQKIFFELYPPLKESKFYH